MTHVSTGDASEAADGLRKWIASGAPQSPAGAYYAWIDKSTNMPAFEYPEITGYALTHFARQNQLWPAEVERGKAAGDWLRTWWQGGRAAHVDYDSGAVYNFDLGMIATGLMSYGSRMGEQSFVDTGLSVARSVRDEIANSGILNSIAHASPADTSRSAWSTAGVAHLLKVAQCLLWANYLGERGFDDAAIALVESSLQAQQVDGRFVTHPADAETMLHPHLYAVEGLYMVGMALGDAKALEDARRGAQWVWMHRLPSGGFPRFVSTQDGTRGPEQMDVTAQALRAARFTSLAPPDVHSTAERLVGCMQSVPDGLAVPYQPDAPVLHLNVWATLFATQALEASVPGTDSLDWKGLV